MKRGRHFALAYRRVFCMMARGRFWSALMKAAIAGLLLFLAATPASAAGSMAVTFVEDRAGQPLDLKGYGLTFNEEFDGPLSLQGPRLFAPVHTPIGAGKFDDPQGPAYAAVEVPGEDGRDVTALSITAYKDGGGWRSGNVQSADAAQSYRQAPFGGKGFACRGCYFEARLKFPQAAPGYWAAFWLLSPDQPGIGHVEVDVIEWYGGDPKGHHQSVHVWSKAAPAKHTFKSNFVGMKDVIADGRWHNYGALQQDGQIVFYVDRREISRVPVTAEFDVPLYALVSLSVLPKEAAAAVGPMVLYADYIRAYAPKGL
ncbi:glycoside hydrolase family 16 protein [Phenylobacterium sp.]|uniref:glycoside hydrolase family 16 protein n=1 Tax=Phenylobacterium sp. TaxID=1871053 RepID=UPI002F410E1F